MKSGVEIVSHEKFKVIKVYIHLFLTVYFVSMSWCVAVGCNSNSFTKDRKKSLKFFQLPKDDNLKKKWLQNIKRENLPKTPTLCQLYFEEHCFKRDLKVSKIDLSWSGKKIINVCIIVFSKISVFCFK